MMISPIQSLSSLTFISKFTLPANFSNLSLSPSPSPSPPPLLPPIRMGGGPRTFPGGVSKWQWKRMQAKKSKQLLKARLARERQIYEMRKRAELKASLSELERPWEVVEKAPNLFSVKADEQLKVLADRFQKPGGFDLWGEEDGPELFKDGGGGRESSRFFPKGVVHSVKPYGGIDELDGSRLVLDCEGEGGVIDWRSVMSGGGSGSDLRAKRLDEMVGGGSSDNRLKGNVFKKRRERRRCFKGEEEGGSREGALDEGNGRRGFREVYDKREYRRQDGMNGSGEVALDEGTGRRNLREYRRQEGMNGLEEMGSREVAFNEGNGRRNLRQGNNKNGYRMQNSSNGSDGMSSRDGAFDEGNGRRNLRQAYNKNGYRMQNSANGSERRSSRDGVLDVGSERRNLRQVHNKREYRMQNSSEKVKGSTKAEVYDLRLERDGRYEFRPEN